MKNDKWKSGFQRDSGETKVRYDLIPLEMLERLAIHYTNGGRKYGFNNWRRANSGEEFARFQQSAWRHFVAWQRGESNEDHAMALVWNIFAYEYLRSKSIRKKVSRKKNGQ